MTGRGHAPEWPDKILVAALLALTAGMLAVMQGTLTAAGASWSQDQSLFVYYVPTWWVLVTGVLAAILGGFAYRQQSWLLTVLGLLAGAVSFGMLGASTLLCVLAIWPLIRSFQEGEETHLDIHRVHAHEWPDKAIMASVFLTTAAALSLLQAGLLAADRITAPLLASRPMTMAVFSAVAGLVGIAGARDAFNLRRAWTSWFGAGLTLAASAFYVIGPAFALAAMLFMGLAYREAEFLVHSTPDND